MAGNSFNSFRIRALHKECLWKRGELDNMRLTVLSPQGNEFAYHQRKLNGIKTELSGVLLRNVPSDYFRSNNCTGVPWLLLRTDRWGRPMGAPEYADLLIALSVACGFVAMDVRKLDALCEDVPFVVVEDRRIATWRRDNGLNKIYGK